MPTYTSLKSQTVKSVADTGGNIKLSAAEKKTGLVVKHVKGHKRPMLCIEPGSEAMAQALESAYHMTLEKAEIIIKERPTNPVLWPYEMQEKAEAMQAAYTATPVAISTSAHYQRRHG